MANTTNYNFEKPAQTDYYDVEVQNNNWDKLDTELKKTNDNKQDTLVSGVSIKTINGESLLGSGNIFIKGGTSSDEVTAKRADVLKGKTTIMNDSADEIVEGTLEVQSIVNFNLSLYASETVMGAWQNPAKGPYSGVKVVYRTDRYPENPDDGTVAYEGSGINFTKKLSPNVKHYFKSYSYMTTNFGRIYSEKVSQGEFTPTVVNSRQVFKSNGIATAPAGARTATVFLVGGGGGGSNPFSYRNRKGNSQHYGGHGGGGGYTKTQSISVTPGQTFAVVVGAGGSIAGNGGASQFGSISVSGGRGATQGYANGNSLGSEGVAANGGSGGGRGGWHLNGSSSTTSRQGGAGGSDGGDGEWDPNYSAKGGTGQHTTTREFAQSGATLYAGGGGGGAATNGVSGIGGAGGGANAGQNASANTGGGGGGTLNNAGGHGGSGIVIVKWT